MNFASRIFRGDRAVWVIFMFLCLISLIEVYSASSQLTFRTDYWRPIMRHSTFLMVGCLIVLLSQAIPPKYFRFLVVFLPISWILLIMVKFFGASVNGADRWFSFFGVSFQPSELAKLALIGTTAFILSRKNVMTPKSSFYWILGLAAGTCIIIFIDNFSTAVLLFGVVCVMMFIGQIQFKHLLKLTVVLVALLILFGCFIFYMPRDIVKKVFPRGITWKERIEDHRQEGNTYVVTDENYQESHAKMAIANGQIFGVLPGKSIERDYLPQAYSDFIYAIIIEELGLVGGLFVALLYLFLFLRAGIIANRCDKLFPKFLVMGAALLLVMQALANMLVAVGILPVTGQPLPLISRGGTSTLINCIYIGIILSVSRYENQRGVQQQELIDKEIEEEKNELATQNEQE